MKIVSIILILLSSVFLSAACSKGTALLADNNPETGLQLSPESPLYSEASAALTAAPTDSIPESASDLLFGKVPELHEVAAFIDKQSNGQAQVIVQVFDPIEIRKSSDLHYPVYVGEEWEDGHRINWYWFYMSEKSGEIFVDSVYGGMEDLQFWRTDEITQKEMALIQDTLSDTESTETDHLKNPVNAIQTKQSMSWEIKNAYNDFLNGRSFFVVDREIRVIDEIMYPYDPNYHRRFALYDVNGDGALELILDGNRLYILSFVAGNLSVGYTDEHYGGSSYFVNSGNLYHHHGGIANTIMDAYDELDDNGRVVRHYGVTAYADYDENTEKWIETYFYSEGGQERPITKEEYDKLIQDMSNDDLIDWQEFNQRESTLMYLR